MGDLGVTHRVHLRLDGKRIVNFLLVMIELFSLALMAKAILSKICRNRRFLRGCQFEHKFSVDGDIVRNPSMDRWRHDAATTLPLEVFTQRNFASDFFWQKLRFCYFCQ